MGNKYRTIAGRGGGDHAMQDVMPSGNAVNVYCFSIQENPVAQAQVRYASQILAAHTSNYPRKILPGCSI